MSLQIQPKNNICSDCYWPFAFSTEEQLFPRNHKPEHKQTKRCQICTNSMHTQPDEKPLPEEKPLNPGGKVVCADCGEMTTLSFLPKEHGRVHCASCFVKKFHLMRNTEHRH